MDINVFKITTYYLLHIGFMIRKYSPLRLYSARPLERMIGFIAHRFKSLSNPGAHAGNLLEYIAATNSLRRINEPITHPTSVIKPLRDPWPYMIRELNQYCDDISARSFLQCINDHFYLNNIDLQAYEYTDLEIFPQFEKGDEKFGSEHFEDGQARATKQVRLKSRVYRPSNSRSDSSSFDNEHIFFGDVIFYFKCDCGPNNEIYCLVKVYKHQTLQNSNVPYRTASMPHKYVVFNVKSIVSNIGYIYSLIGHDINTSLIII
ncbi:hypothetical protein H4219_006016 [Mycoemilia scoparia]|uniref:Uncharacterized protein n=1 Tax=Mycoemilia scoparia TaxID=417184 RepID=A0A9W7ZQV0_9FUNG|nr:hypothetical protein H4219_006016 [Mycoemilia scoparia]